MPVLKTLPDIGPTGPAPVTVGADTAIWVCFSATGTGAAPRIGDSLTSASRGLAINPGVAPTIFRANGAQGAIYPLTGVFAYVPPGSSLTVMYLA